MITSTDIANLLYRDCEAFGIQRIPHGETAVGGVGKERIVIHSKRQQPGRIWKKSFVEVNICVPDLSPTSANTIRLNELERLAYSLLDDVVGSYDGTSYHYSIDSTGMEKDEQLKCHYVNIRILFEVLND